MPFQRIGIIGVGLIGGSLGLAIKRSDPAVHILGVGRNPEKLEFARNIGAVDEWQLEPGAALADRDLIVLATPVEQILLTLRVLGDRLSGGTVVTDVGSTKRRICSEGWANLPEGVYFIGGHPIAGREVAGVEHSVADLFEDAPYVLCPGPGTRLDDLDRLVDLVDRVGARPRVISPEEHDRLIAWVSHLPQLLSTALGGMMAGEKGLEISGSGFRDMARLAGSPWSVWKSILETNWDNIDRAVAEFIQQLQRMRLALKTGDLAEEFSRAADVYRTLTSQRDKS